MAHILNDKEEMVSCPYDPVHRMKSSRLQIHITKCRMNNLHKQVEVCPFNATHILERGTLKAHLIQCKCRHPLDRELSANIDRNNVYKGRTSVPSYNQPAVHSSDEIWEVDTLPSDGYVPPSLPSEEGLITDLGMMKPAQRKQFYKSRTLPDANSSEGESSSAQENGQSMQSASPSSQNSMSSPPNVGLGRGAQRAVTPNGATSSPTLSPTVQLPRQPRSYREVVSQMTNSNLGIGRGRHVPSAGASQGTGRGGLLRN